MHALSRCLGLAALLVPSLAVAKGGPDADEIVEKTLDVDALGMGGANVDVSILIRDDRGGKERKVGFRTRSLKHSGSLTKSLVRVSTPADLAGMSFLQIQKDDDDDERFVYLPELHKTRRIAGKSRSNAFMGTDYSYADVDRRDLRHSKRKIVSEETLENKPVWKIEAKPTDSDAEYGRLVLWVRKDNFVTLKMEMYSKSDTLWKTQSARELRRIDGRWFVTRSLMQDHQRSRTSETTMDKIDTKNPAQDGEFTVRNLEKL